VPGSAWYVIRDCSASSAGRNVSKDRVPSAIAWAWAAWSTPAASARTARPTGSSTACRATSRRTTASARTAPTYGGYSENVVDESFVVRIPDGLSLDVAAPLLCAGITLYSSLKRFGADPGKKVAIVGLGGLGHMGVKIANALGAEVTVLSQSLRKQEDRLRLGADHYYATSDPKTFEELAGTFDLIVSTVSAPLDLNVVGGGLLALDSTETHLSPNLPAAALTAATARARQHLALHLPGTLASCRLESLPHAHLAEAAPATQLPLVHGLVDLPGALAHWDAAEAAGVRAAPLHLLDHTVPRRP
jgi:threonine dehydrogenase-like Zn-dependent dehydrogenase